MSTARAWLGIWVVMSKFDGLYDKWRQQFLDGKITLSETIEQTMTAIMREEKKMSEGGRKESDGKPPMDLIPPIVLTALAEILAFGAQKYEPYNWAKGLPWSKVYAAMQRHLNSWWSGERYDKETNKSHLWHALCDLAFLITYEHYGMGTEDKPVWPPTTFQPPTPKQNENYETGGWPHKRYKEETKSKNPDTFTALADAVRREQQREKYINAVNDMVAAQPEKIKGCGSTNCPVCSPETYEPVKIPVEYDPDR